MNRVKYTEEYPVDFGQGEAQKRQRFDDENLNRSGAATAANVFHVLTCRRYCF